MNGLQKLLHYVMLPAAISQFERDHLARMNRVARGFFATHLPVFVVIAWLNDTNPILAALLTGAVLVIPLAAPFVFSNPRTVSVTHGFTSMLMGGLLVHFGQGDLQIEMHFYFFVLIALLSVFGNPIVIITAAVTVALHHLVLWFLIPESVFNYEAPVWVVAVHAAFVVLESVAACFLARSFFDNVIGLEKIVADRTRELDVRNRDMRLILDHAHQGFLTLDREGRMRPETSAVVEKWLGEVESGRSFADYIGAHNTVAGETFGLGWDDLQAGDMPPELVLDQLPANIHAEERDLHLRYRPIDDGQGLVLVVIDDVTAATASARLEAEQRQAARVFEHIMSDRNGFLEFYEEADGLVRQLAEGGLDLPTTIRAVHTLKGNCGIFGIQTVAEHCHALESHMVEERDFASAGDLAELQARWHRVGANLSALVGQRAKRRLEIDDADYEAVLGAVMAGAPRADVARMLRRWRLEPTAMRLTRLAEQAQRLAERVGKGELKVEIEHGDLRIAPARWAPFWSAMVHVLRNAIDHGIETRQERAANSKSPTPCLSLQTAVEGSDLIVRVVDDGRGIDWDRLRAAAQGKGMAADTEAELMAALFADGISTSEAVTELSGRGVGMAAVRDATEAAGGRVRVQSKTASGTSIEFRFPIETEREVALAFEASRENVSLTAH